jgi:hypothetical protein
LETLLVPPFKLSSPSPPSRLSTPPPAAGERIVAAVADQRVIAKTAICSFVRAVTREGVVASRRARIFGRTNFLV